jgi:hypothetical protein
VGQRSVSWERIVIVGGWGGGGGVGVGRGVAEALGEGGGGCGDLAEDACEEVSIRGFVLRRTGGVIQ